MSDAGAGYGGALALRPRDAVPSALEKAMVSALTRAMQQPVKSYGPTIMLDDFGRQALDFRLSLNMKDLQNILPDAKPANLEVYLPILKQNLPSYGITTPERVAAFLGQVGVESAGFSTLPKL